MSRVTKWISFIKSLSDFNWKSKIDYSPHILSIQLALACAKTENVPSILGGPWPTECFFCTFKVIKRIQIPKECGSSFISESFSQFCERISVFTSRIKLYYCICWNNSHVISGYELQMTQKYGDMNDCNLKLY